eukprot:TRINITY_DN7510_c0_g1_i2.p1 TRINITY_DN7510_c0_g1~~TRINITY_DN7510_c0_g1_i2.p1  ORF type:complete len:617 (+),score=73.63 TRINITY_DN7510_c0_g1_i2:63-1853(+)
MKKKCWLLAYVRETITEDGGCVEILSGSKIRAKTQLQPTFADSNKKLRTTYKNHLKEHTAGPQPYAEVLYNFEVGTLSKARKIFCGNNDSKQLVRLKTLPLGIGTAERKASAASRSLESTFNEEAEKQQAEKSVARVEEKTLAGETAATSSTDQAQNKEIVSRTEYPSVQLLPLVPAFKVESSEAPHEDSLLMDDGEPEAQDAGQSNAKPRKTSKMLSSIAVQTPGASATNRLPIQGEDLKTQTSHPAAKKSVTTPKRESSEEGSPLRVSLPPTEGLLMLTKGLEPQFDEGLVKIGYIKGEKIPEADIEMATIYYAAVEGSCGVPGVNISCPHKETGYKDYEACSTHFSIVNERAVVLEILQGPCPRTYSVDYSKEQKQRHVLVTIAQLKRFRNLKLVRCCTKEGAIILREACGDSTRSFVTKFLIERGDIFAQDVEVYVTEHPSRRPAIEASTLEQWRGKLSEDAYNGAWEDYRAQAKEGGRWYSKHEKRPKQDNPAKNAKSEESEQQREAKLKLEAAKWTINALRLDLSRKRDELVQKDAQHKRDYDAMKRERDEYEEKCNKIQAILMPTTTTGTVGTQTVTNTTEACAETNTL